MSDNMDEPDINVYTIIRQGKRKFIVKMINVFHEQSRYGEGKIRLCFEAQDLDSFMSEQNGGRVELATLKRMVEGAHNNE